MGTPGLTTKPRALHMHHVQKPPRCPEKYRVLGTWATVAVPVPQKLPVPDHSSRPLAAPAPELGASCELRVALWRVEGLPGSTVHTLPRDEDSQGRAVGGAGLSGLGLLALSRGTGPPDSMWQAAPGEARPLPRDEEKRRFQEGLPQQPRQHHALHGGRVVAMAAASAEREAPPLHKKPSTTPPASVTLRPLTLPVPVGAPTTAGPGRGSKPSIWWSAPGPTADRLAGRLRCSHRLGSPWERMGGGEAQPGLW